MNIVIIWIFQILLAIWFGFGAYKKLSTPIEKIVNNKSLPFAGNPVPIVALGCLEFLGAISMLISPLFCPMLTALTATCFCFVMCGAAIVHLKNKTYTILPLIAVAMLLSIIVAYYRF